MINYRKFISTVEKTQLPAVGFDTHAHLSRKYFAKEAIDREHIYNSLSTVVSTAKNTAIAKILSICLDEEAYEDAIALYDMEGIDIYSAVGVHPCDVGKKNAYSLDILRAILQKDSRCKAIGETGLDFYWKDVPPHVQYTSFKEHIALAKEFAKPLILHTRNAEEAVFEMLCSHTMHNHPCIWHCYCGSKALAEKIIECGWYISFAGNITYPNAGNLREIVHVIPSNRLLIETDSPYLTPQVQRGSTNQPSYLMYIAEVIACELQSTVQEVWKQTSSNAKEVLGIE